MTSIFQPGQASGDELLYFWAFGDLHYNAPQQWRARHTQRLAPMFRDLRALWSQEGAPAFCLFWLQVFLTTGSLLIGELPRSQSKSMDS